MFCNILQVNSYPLLRKACFKLLKLNRKITFSARNPMTITGNMENPKVEIRKGKEKDKLEETEDEKDGE